MSNLVCDKCGSSISLGSKFCPQCGDPVDEKDIVNLPVNNSHKEIFAEITFGKSSSANYQKAIDICNNIPSYEVLGADKNITHKIILPVKEADLIVTLFDLVGSWKSSKMLIDGTNSTKKDLTYGGIGCYRERLKSSNPEQFCYGVAAYGANIWGCDRLSLPIYHWSGGWLKFGKIDNNGVWHFDKNKIKHELEQGIERNKLCPIINRKNIFDTLDKLPPTINPKTDKNWTYITETENLPGGAYREIAVGVKPNIKKLNNYVVSTYIPKWTYDENSSQENNTIEVSLSYKDDDPKSKENQEKMGTLGVLMSILLLFIIIYFFNKC